MYDFDLYKNIYQYLKKLDLFENKFIIPSSINVPSRNAFTFLPPILDLHKT